MTTKVLITNLSGSHNISVRKVEPIDDAVLVEDAKILFPHYSTEYMIWGNQRLLVEEQQIDENHSA